MTTSVPRLATAMFIASAFIALGVGARGQGADPAATLVARAGQYVRDHEPQFTSMVGEEHQIQRLVKANGATAKQRDLVSDVLIVKSQGARNPVVLRDVIAVDGKALRNRDERLRKLFTSRSRGALSEAQAIVDEGARHDLEFLRFKFLSGVILPLVIVAAPGDRYRFSIAEDGVSMSEIKSPTLYRQGRGSMARDMPLGGRLGIDATTGALRSASVKVGNPDLDATVDVRYAEDAGLFVPVQMHETYRLPAKPKDNHLEILSDYTKFRRFEVKVEEQIGLPSPQ